MSNWRDHEPVSDEDLVAYLDGLLEQEDASGLEREVNMDQELATRLDLLRRGGRPFAEIYDLLLHEAPNKRLKQILKLAKEPPPLPPVEEPEPPATHTQRPPRLRVCRLPRSRLPSHATISSRIPSTATTIGSINKNHGK